MRREKDPDGQRRRMAAFKTRQRVRQEAQAGRPRPSACEICSEISERVVFDHCHTGGHFRGWICDRCNRVLGSVKDDPNLLRKLATYVEIGHGTTDDETAQRAA